MISVVLGLFALLLSGVYVYGIAQIPLLSIGDPLGPRVFPMLLAGSLVAVAVLLLIEGIRTIRVREGLVDVGEYVRTDFHIFLAASAWLLLFYFSFEPVGYLISVAVFLTGMMLLAHHGQRWVAVTTALTFSVVSYLLFTQVFNVPLPTGLSPV